MTLAVTRLVIREESETPPPSPRAVSEAEREYLMRMRESLMLQLNAIEDYLGLERSLIARRKRAATPQRT